MPLVDVRTAAEYAEGHIAGASNADVKQDNFVDQVRRELGSDLKGARVAVYCLRGSRSLKAAKLLSAEGAEVYNLAGGITAWHSAGRPTTH